MHGYNEQAIEQIQTSLRERTVTLSDQVQWPCLGQGTWNMGENPAHRQQEIAALRLGVELGMTVIDTAEMYGDGRSEQLIGEAIKGSRERVALVSKVYPHHSSLARIEASCEASLRRLGTDYLDMYLLHWRGRVPLAEVAEGMERLVNKGKILRWGVSNFAREDMEELMHLPVATPCTTNQVLYHLGSRGIEYDLLVWHRQQRMPVMAYCPLAQAGTLRRGLLHHPMLVEIANKYDVKPIQLLLAWCIHRPDIIAIPKASTVEHVLDNAAAASIYLRNEDLYKLDQAFPAPDRKMPLDIV